MENKEIMKAVRRQSREEEIKLHGKQVSRRRHVEENPKAYKRKRFDYRKSQDAFSFFFCIFDVNY